MEFKITFLSDLHNRHLEWEIQMTKNRFLDQAQNSDAIVFCGDISNLGTKHEIENFLDWYTKFLPGIQKFFIPGNHDFFFDHEWFPRTVRGALRQTHKSKYKDVEELLARYPEIVYLNDSGFEFMNVKFWGSPITPWFNDWAFNRWKHEIGYHWEKIPADVDVLVTHGPPYLILDKLDSRFRSENENVGCQILLEKIKQVQPRVHAFGHIHESYGIFSAFETIFVNASSLDQYYQPVNPPITVKIVPKAWKNKE